MLTTEEYLKIRYSEKEQDVNNIKDLEVRWREVCHDTAEKLEEVVAEISKLRDTISASTGEAKRALEELINQQLTEPKIDLGLLQFYNGRYSVLVYTLKDIESLMTRL